MTAIRAALASLMVLALAACTMNPPSGDFPVPRYTDEPPVRLDVADIRVEQRYQPPMEAPNVEHEAPVSPADAAKQWVQDRLRAAGTQGSATVVISQAAIVREKLETKEGISGFFTSEPAVRYTGDLEIAVKMRRPNRDGSVRITASRSTATQEGASPHERDSALHGLVTKLMDDAGAQLAETLKANTGGFVVSGAR
ncbi:hypothetical protein SAMN05216241_11114 [Limimonas halophila]|uniref:Lipoprotein n=1 Tax=Limimonas halophila TaxID=1082479 RepID=A0A1G7U0R0_9PROT|nr:hypothetical protein [Limimonas halophila]SDG40629.1 hypothetical protein SAMN05216241_11114 [Limimonas halophila]